MKPGIESRPHSTETQYIGLTPYFFCGTSLDATGPLRCGGRSFSCDYFCMVVLALLLYTIVNKSFGLVAINIVSIRIHWQSMVFR